MDNEQTMPDWVLIEALAARDARIEQLEAEIARKDAALALCAKHVDWMPHPHSVAVEAAIRAAQENPHEPA